MQKLGLDRWAIVILGWGFLFRLVCAYVMTPGFDEAYYTLYSRHLDWSYFDHPPLVAYTTGIGIWLTGITNQFTIRLGTVILYSFTLIFFYLTSNKLFGLNTARITLAMVTTIPIFQIIFGIFTLPDVPLMFFWTLTLWLCAQEFFADEPVEKYQPTHKIMWIGLTVGLATLGKYHGFLLGACLVLFVLFTPKYWRLWRSPYLLGAWLFFLLAISPILIWNYQHDWVSLRFQGNRAIPQNGYNLLELLGVFLVSCAYLFPTLGFPLWWISLRSLYREMVNPPNYKYRFILWTSVPIFLGFTLMGGYRQVLPSWHMPGFFTAVLIMGNQIAIAQSKRPQFIRNWLWGSGVMIILLITIALAHINLGIAQKGSQYAILGGFLEVKDDPSTQIFDLQQVTNAFVSDPELKAELAEADFVFANNFFVAGQLGMAIEPLGKPVACFDGDMRGFAYWSRPEQFLGKNALYITTAQFDLADLDDPNSGISVLRYGDYFQSLTKIKDILIYRGGQVINTLPVYRAVTLRQPYPFPY
ncbi:MAG: ArnT family glycosyltransferase [Pseudanabaenaceae cyanobacterium]